MRRKLRVKTTKLWAQGHPESELPGVRLPHPGSTCPDAGPQAERPEGSVSAALSGPQGAVSSWSKALALGMGREGKSQRPASPFQNPHAEHRHTVYREATACRCLSQCPWHHPERPDGILLCWRRGLSAHLGSVRFQPWRTEISDTDPPMPGTSPALLASPHLLPREHTGVG